MPLSVLNDTIGVFELSLLIYFLCASRVLMFVCAVVAEVSRRTVEMAIHVQETMQTTLRRLAETTNPHENSSDICESPGS